MAEGCSIQNHFSRRAPHLRPSARQSGLALLVIVGILTALFIMGSTFALLMRAERRSSQNFAMHESASRRARDSLSGAIQLLAYTCQSYADTYGSAWSQTSDTFVITDEDAKFNLNAMGYPADLGSEADYRQRFLSFETSLVRVLMNVPAVVQTYADEDARRKVCVWIAREITERRYGDPRSLTTDDPKGSDTIPKPGTENVNDFDSTSWSWSLQDGWVDSDGTSQPGWTDFDDPGFLIGSATFGDGDGYASTFTRVDSGVPLFDAEEHIWQGQNPATTWGDDAGTGYPASGGPDPRLEDLGWHDSAPSAVRDHKGGLHTEQWVGKPNDIDDLGEYDPEAPLADDQAYASIYQIPAIIQYVLHNQYYGDWSEDVAWLKTTRLFNGFDEGGNHYAGIRDFITVHSHTRRAKAPNAAVTTDLVKLVKLNPDDPENGGWTDPQDLADKLGLISWAGDNAGRRRQAAQLVANIIDFADGRTDPADTSLDGDAPTEVKLTFSDGTESPPAYGCEGLHITEIMAAAAAMQAYGTRTTTPLPGQGWQWQAAGYYRVEGPDTIARTDTFTFINIPAGWYAIRIFAYDQQQQLPADPGVRFTYPSGGASSYTVRCNRGSDPGPYHGYVRTASGKLVAVQVDGTRKLTFDLTGTKPAGGTGPSFVSIQLLPQYVTITNIAMQDPRLTGSHRIAFACDPNYYELFLSDGATLKTVSLGVGSYACGYDVSARNNFLNSIPAARADPNYPFPVKYGFYTVALSEEAYAKNYGAEPTPNATWGDDPDEDYPVLFVGDRRDADVDSLDTDAAADARADQFDLRQQNLTVYLKIFDGNLMAGREIDGAQGLGTMANPLKDFVSIEKTSVDAREATDWKDHTAALPIAELRAGSSQNRLVAVPDDARRGVASYGIRTNLNVQYYDDGRGLYQSVTGVTFKRMTDLAGDNQHHDYQYQVHHYITLPIILNRPYASPGWLGLVPSGTPWHTIDARMLGPDPPDPANPPNPARLNPEDLLGLLMQNAIVDGYYARVNINTAQETVLKGLFDDVTAHRLVLARTGTDASRRGHEGWWTWDELLTEPCLQEYDTENVGYFQAIKDPPDLDVETVREDSGAGSYADGFIDDSDEREEWFRRFSGLIDIRSTAFKVTAIGTLPNVSGTTEAESKIEAIVDRDRDTDGDGYQNCNIVEFRYVTEAP